MALGDNVYVMTKHRPVEMVEFEHPSDHPRRDTDIPIGAILARPWPEARLYYVSHQNGWFYAYWVDDRLTKSPPPGSPPAHSGRVRIKNYGYEGWDGP